MSREAFIKPEAEKLIKEFPEMPTRALARMFQKRHSDFTFEQARQAIRYARGETASRKGKTTPSVPIRTNEEKKQALASCLKFPLPEYNPFKVYHLPKEVKKWLVISDVHIPFQDNSALTTAVQYGKDQNCDGLLILGDFMDGYHLSDFVHDPLKRHFKDELEMARPIFNSIVDYLGPKKVMYKLSNHEDRLDRYILKHAPELWGLPGIDFASFFNVPGIEWVPSYCPIRHGKLTLLHGHEYGGSVSEPVNPARGMYLKARECVLFGHMHKSSEHTDPTLLGTTITCWSMGCLCDTHPEYRPLNKWNQGFAILNTDTNWRVENKRIVNGDVL
jgi:predicted phosphodiesterase